MSLADHFEPVADAGFYQTVKPETARRQFNMSLALVAVLTLVALIVGATAGFGGVQEAARSGVSTPATLVVQAPSMVHVHSAAAKMRLDIGG
jgi:hypothetical protein